jgi:hypothetical protein
MFGVDELEVADWHWLIDLRRLLIALVDRLEEVADCTG